MSFNLRELETESISMKLRTCMKTLGIILLILLQVAIYVVLAIYLEEYSVIITSVLTVLGVIVALFVFSSRSDAYYKLAWILLILVMPIIASIAYIILRNQIAPKRLNARIQKNAEISKKYLAQTDQLSKLPEHSPFIGLANYTYNSAGYPAYTNCDFKFFPLGDDFYVGLMSEIEKAEKFIFLEFFIIKYGYMWPSILDLLRKKVEEGVEVRVMYDGFNSLSAIPHSYHRLIKSYGIKCRVFLPFKAVASKLQNNRDHRKILVIDGKVAFTGGNNLADEYMNKVRRFGHWKDTSIMVRGEAVKSFTMMFLEMWNSSKVEDTDYGAYIYEGDYEIENGEGYTIPYGFSPVSEEMVGEYVYLDILYNAKKYVHIMTPYLVPDDKIKTALIMAAKRGVDVKLMLPHIPDKKYAFCVARSFYEELLEGGVKIYEYEPGFLHAKQFIADDKVCTVGTINLDYRSLYLHFECGLLVYNNKVVREIEEDYEKTLNSCIEVDMEYYKSMSWVYRMLGKVLRVTGPLL